MITVTSRNSAANPKVSETDTRKVFNAGRHFMGMFEISFVKSAATGISLAFGFVTKYSSTVFPIQVYNVNDGTWSDLTWSATATDLGGVPIWMHPGMELIVVDITETGTGDTDTLAIGFHTDDERD